MKTCDVEGCEKPARSPKAALCPMHYHRQYRHGDLTRSANATDVTVSHGRRYRPVYAPNHRVSGKRGMAYEHRIVLHDAIGPGVHECHWCATKVEWLPKGDPRELQVDHLNGIGDDNRPENLVPACRRCNTARGSQRRHDALVAAGWWSNHDTIEALGARAPRIEELSTSQ